MLSLTMSYRGKANSVQIDAGHVVEFVIVENRKDVISFEGHSRTLFITEMLQRAVEQKLKVFYIGANKYIPSRLSKLKNSSEFQRVVFLWNEDFSVGSYLNLLMRLGRMLNPNVKTLVIVDDYIEYFRDIYQQILQIRSTQYQDKVFWSYHYVKALEGCIDSLIRLSTSKNAGFVLVRHAGHGEAINLEYRPNLMEQVLYELLPKRYVVRYNKYGVTLHKLPKPSEVIPELKWFKNLGEYLSSPSKTPPGAPSSRGASGQS